ncbi:MAG: hypothetical protein HOH37_00960 [Gammaproteobacteria bacterium]|nr:hypothetical protein [Gammaproteobacteria bacterium]
MAEILRFCGLNTLVLNAGSGIGGVVRAQAKFVSDTGIAVNSGRIGS